MSDANRRAEVDAATQDVDFEKNEYLVELETTEGPIRLKLFPDVAPGHCRNMIGLTRIGFYDGILFHRVISQFVIQAGCPRGDGTGGPGYTIDAEFNDLPHDVGTLSMARTRDPNSAGSQFFICLAKVPHLDGNYTVFGKTADEESLQTVLRIGEKPTDADDRPVQDVRIEKARVIVRPKTAS